LIACQIDVANVKDCLYAIDHNVSISTLGHNRFLFQEERTNRFKQMDLNQEGNYEVKTNKSTQTKGTNKEVNSITNSQ